MQNETQKTKGPPTKSGPKFSRILEKPLFWVVFVALAFGVPLYRSMIRKAPDSLPILGQLQNFELTNQEGKRVSLAKNYLGTVMVVNFVFTSCPVTCPLLSAQMKKIQERVRRARGGIQLLSISVDPETDTPAVLKKYATRYGADPIVWSFLTGPLEQIQDVVVKSFKVALDFSSKTGKGLPANTEAPSELMDITHGEHFVIVDQAGQIRDYQRANNDSEINEIVRKVAILMNSNPASQRAR